MNVGVITTTILIEDLYGWGLRRPEEEVYDNVPSSYDVEGIVKDELTSLPDGSILRTITYTYEEEEV